MTISMGGQFPVESAVVSVTCVIDGRSHGVPDAELAGRSRLDGYYTAVCGHIVTAAPMAEPDGTPCPVCTERVDATEYRPGRRERPGASTWG